MEEQQPSLVKNLTGGAGCGCGCLGLLGMLLGVLLLAAIPLQIYENPSGSETVLASVLLVLGALGAGFGVVVWLVSILID